MHTRSQFFHTFNVNFFMSITQYNLCSENCGSSVMFTENISEQFRLEPIMLKNLPIILSRTSQNFYPLFLIYSQIITYYSFIILILLS